MPTGIAAKKSSAECCLINIVEAHISATAITTNNFQSFEASFDLSQTDIMPKEYAQCSDGKTPVLVSKEYKNPIQSVKKLSRGNSAGRKF